MRNLHICINVGLLSALLLIITCGCISVQPKGTSRSEVSNNDSALAAPRPVPTPIDFTVSGSVPKLKQPTSMTCWATAATIMRSWKDNVTYKIADVMQKAGTDYQQKFQKNKGMLGSEKNFFLEAMSLKAELPQTYTVAGWLTLLRTNGPVWVTTDEDPTDNFSIHARILKGLVGDGTADATFMTFIDPATGAQSSESVTVFTKKFEDVAKADKAKDLRPQVVHY